MKLIYQLLLFRALLTASVRAEEQARDYYGADELTLREHIQDTGSVDKSSVMYMYTASSTGNTPVGVTLPFPTAKSEHSGMQAHFPQLLPSDIHATGTFLDISPNLTKSNYVIPANKLSLLDNSIFFRDAVEDNAPGKMPMNYDNLVFQGPNYAGRSMIDNTALLVDPSTNVPLVNKVFSATTMKEQYTIPTFPALLLGGSPMIESHCDKCPMLDDYSRHPESSNDSGRERSMPNLHILSSEISSSGKVGPAHLEIQPKSMSSLQILVYPEAQLPNTDSSECNSTCVNRQKRHLHELDGDPEAVNGLRTQVGKINDREDLHNNNTNKVCDGHGGTANDEEFSSSNNPCYSKQVLSDDQSKYTMLRNNSKWTKVSEKPDQYLNEVGERKWQNNDESEDCFLIKTDNGRMKNEMHLSECSDKDVCGGNEHLLADNVCCSSSVADEELVNHFAHATYSPRKWRISTGYLSKRGELKPDSVTKRYETKIPESEERKDMNLQENDIECECAENKHLHDFAQDEDSCKMSSDFAGEPDDEVERGPCNLKNWRNWRNTPNPCNQYLNGASEWKSKSGSPNIQTKVSDGDECDDSQMSELENGENECFHVYAEAEDSHCTSSDFDDESETYAHNPCITRKLNSNPKSLNKYFNNQSERISKNIFPNEFCTSFGDDTLPCGKSLETDEELSECEGHDDRTQDKEESAAFDTVPENNYNDASCTERTWRTINENPNDVFETATQHNLQSDISSIDRRSYDNEEGHFFVIPYKEDGVIEEYKPNSHVFDVESFCAFAPPHGNQDESVNGINLWEDWTDIPDGG